MLRVDNLSYDYAGKPALKDISMVLPREHIVAVLGESGSGKTTLLKCIGRFLKPGRGRILLNDRDIFEIDEVDFRKAIGIVFQQLHLFPHLTVLENMTLAPEKVLGRKHLEVREEALQTLSRLGIEDMRDRYPSQISGGQAQRAAIARALVMKPEYLLLDEPTSALDVNTTEDFGKWLVSLKDETTFVIVTHDVLFAGNIANSGVLINNGRIEVAGKINHILERLNKPA